MRSLQADFKKQYMTLANFFRHEGARTNSRIPVFGRFRSKSKLDYFCFRPFPKFRAFLGRSKTDTSRPNFLWSRIGSYMKDSGKIRPFSPYLLENLYGPPFFVWKFDDFRATDRI
jgi:hypothetical protein